MAKPLIRWAGSKRKLVPVLKTLWGRDAERSDAQYIEPFAGSACLFFEVNPRNAVLGDINSELIGTYRTVRRYPHRVHEQLSNMSGDKYTYYRVRSQEPTRLSCIARAARFIYLNRYCFNGLYRTNERGLFNVPYGGGKSGTLPGAEDLVAASRLLKGVELIAGDFAVALARAKPGDFVYLDPPYHVSDRRVFREYGSQTFSPQDVRRLRTSLEKLQRIGAHFVVSYADSKEGRFLAKGFTTRRIPIRRNIAGFVGHRRLSMELLVSNFRQRQERN